MATAAQIAANRINAQKSTGPKTPEGKEAVRLNGLKHGLASDILVLPGESESDFHNLLDSLEAEHQPATATEVILVRQMAMASWRLQRIVHMEAAQYRLSRTQLQDFYKSYYDDQLTEPERQAIVFERESGNTLIAFSRYEGRLERSFHKSLTALQRLRALRKKEEIGFGLPNKQVPAPAAVKTPAKTAPDATIRQDRPANGPIPIRQTTPAAPPPGTH